MVYIPTFEGGCLCSGVRYVYKGHLVDGLGPTTVCHCSQCRKAQGYASASIPVATAGLKVLSGAALIREFESSPGEKRAFCGVCGSPLYARKDSDPDRLRLRLGSLDAAPAALTIDAHIYVEDAPQWTGPDEAPRYPRLEPGADGVG